MGDKELGIRLKKAREQAKLTQQEVCDTIDIPKVQTLSSYERGINNPPLEILKKLTILYNVSADNLLFGNDYLPKRTKTEAEYMHQFIEAIDHLPLYVNFEPAESGSKEYAWIDLISKAYAVDFNNLMLHWARLLNLRVSHTIEPEEYAMLITRRIEEFYNTKEAKTATKPTPAP